MTANLPAMVSGFERQWAHSQGPQIAVGEVHALHPKLRLGLAASFPRPSPHLSPCKHAILHTQHLCCIRPRLPALSSVSSSTDRPALRGLITSPWARNHSGRPSTGAHKAGNHQPPPCAACGVQ